MDIASLLSVLTTSIPAYFTIGPTVVVLIILFTLIGKSRSKVEAPAMSSAPMPATPPVPAPVSVPMQPTTPPVVVAPESAPLPPTPPVMPPVLEVPPVVPVEPPVEPLTKPMPPAMPPVEQTVPSMSVPVVPPVVEMPKEAPIEAPVSMPEPQIQVGPASIPPVSTWKPNEEPVPIVENAPVASGAPSTEQMEIITPEGEDMGPASETSTQAKPTF